VFKRLRGGLFKRQDADQDALNETEESPTEAPEALEATGEDVAPVRDDALDAPSVGVTSPTTAPGSLAEASEAACAEDVAPEDAEQPSGAHEVAQKRGFFNPFKLSLGRTRQLFGRVNESLAHDPITMICGMSWKRHSSAAMLACRQPSALWASCMSAPKRSR
jgi:hypothetical protein